MKNFYVTSLYNIKELPAGTYALYKYLLGKSLDSAKKYLAGEYEIIVIDKKLNRFQELYLDQYEFIYNLYKKNHPCNVLYCGSDIIFRKNCDIFNELQDGFRIFNYTCVKKWPQQHDPAQQNYLRDCINISKKYNFNIKYVTKNNNLIQVNPYLNCDIRYFSNNLDAKILDYGLELMRMWKNKYNYVSHGDQFIYNLMQWTQNYDASEAVIPKYGYQFVNKSLNKGGNDRFNGIKLRDAEIAHVHLSLFIGLFNYQPQNRKILDGILNAIDKCENLNV